VSKGDEEAGTSIVKFHFSLPEEAGTQKTPSEKASIACREGA
jgi:hypothetical protein